MKTSVILSFVVLLGASSLAIADSNTGTSGMGTMNPGSTDKDGFNSNTGTGSNTTVNPNDVNPVTPSSEDEKGNTNVNKSPPSTGNTGSAAGQ